MNATQAAAVLGVSSRSLYDLAAPAGPIPCTRIGRRVIFEESDLLEYKAKCRFTETRNAVVSSLSSAAVSVDKESALESFFRKRGIAPRRTPSTARSRPSSTPRSTASVVPIRSSMTPSPST